MNRIAWMLGALSVLTGLGGCQTGGLNWEATFAPGSAYASPLAADLNQDGTLDLILGGGGAKEGQPGPYGLLALNGRDGSLLWTVPCRNQLTGTPALLDLNADGVPEVIIGGRWAQLMAVDGRSGTVIWEYLPTLPPGDPAEDSSLLNFSSPLVVPDQDGDGLADLLLAYGGYVAAPAYDPARPAGQLMLIASSSGAVLARAPMPDGAETYLSPVLLSRQGEPWVIFGSGGETLPGKLFATPLSDLLDQQLDQAQVWAHSERQGFIAAPVLADLTGDGQEDLLVQAYDGRTLALDGADGKVIWEITAEASCESHVQPLFCPGNGAGDYRVFLTLNQGQWPEAGASRQYLYEPERGHLHLLDSLGLWPMGGAILARNATGAPVIIGSLNRPKPTGFSFESGRPAIASETQLWAWSLEGQAPELLLAAPGINLGPTPLLTDLNGDGQPELVFVYNQHPYDIERFGGIRVVCRSLKGWENLETKNPPD